METWYKTWWCNHEIQPVSVIRSTDKCVFVPPRPGAVEPWREMQITDYHHYHRTYAEARQWIIDKARQDVANAEKRVRCAENLLAAAERIPIEPPQS